MTAAGRVDLTSVVFIFSSFSNNASPIFFFFFNPHLRICLLIVGGWVAGRGERERMKRPLVASNAHAPGTHNRGCTLTRNGTETFWYGAATGTPGQGCVLDTYSPYPAIPPPTPHPHQEKKEELTKIRRLGIQVCLLLFYASLYAKIICFCIVDYPSYFRVLKHVSERAVNTGDTEMPMI